MLIIAGYLQVDPDRRDAYVAAHVDLVRRARRSPGCLDLAITADPVEAPDTGIAVLGGDVMEYGVADVRPVFG